MGISLILLPTSARNRRLCRTLTTLQDYRIESGEPSGELKIRVVP